MQRNAKEGGSQRAPSGAPLGYGAKFKLLKQLLPNPKRQDHPEPRKRWWKDVDVIEMSNGRLSTGYLSQLNKDEIEQPGLEKLALIADIMDFPVELWLLEPEQWERRLGTGIGGIHGSGRDPDEGDREYKITDLIERLFASIKNPRTGQTFTNKEVAERSNGRLTEKAVESLRDQDFADPTRSQLLGLCEAFGVSFSYFAGPVEQDPVIHDDAAESFQTTIAAPLAQKSKTLSDEHMNIVLAITEQLAKVEDLQQQSGDS